MNIKLSIVLALSSLIVTSCGPTKKKELTNMKTNSGIDLNNLDTNVNPGDNFFEYANGGWLKSNPIPAEYSRYGAFEVLAKKNQEEIKSIIEEVSTRTNIEKGSPEQQIRDFYNSGMDTNKIEELGIKPIESVIIEINGLNSKAELIEIQAKLNMKGLYPLFAVYSSQDEKNSTEIIANLSQGGLGLPDRDYYTKEDERSKGIRIEYINHIQKMLELAGETEDVAAKKAKEIMAFETILASASMTRLEQRDPHATYNIRTINEISKEAPGYDFKAYLSYLGLSDLKSANIHQPFFFKEMAKAFNTTDINTLKDYFIWNVINGNASSLSSEFVNQNFYFYSTVLSGVDKMRPRWKRIISSTNGSLGDPVGKLYVEKYFPASSKEIMVELVGNLRKALKESIQNLDWMSDITKQKAEEKLAAINLKVGYPNKWLDYSKVEITPDNYIQNKWNCNEFSYKRNLAKIGKPVDREEWGMNPQTVNAYYSPNMNEIVFPAAILQPPFFDPSADDAVNYGAIGVVIGHEMTHGFDDQGRQYDKDGNLNNWWTDEDAKNFKAKTQILIKEYSNYKVLDSLPINGELTLGENIADNGGLFISYAALQKAYEKNGKAKNIDGLTSDQRFLISYAQVWRQHIRPKALMRRLQEDVHSPGIARVNVGVANLPWWYSAFNIKEEDKNYIAPENRAKIW